MKEPTVLLNGCSKSFAMTGFRVGYACAPAAIIEAMMKIHQYAIMCASVLSQEAAIEALEKLLKGSCCDAFRLRTAPQLYCHAIQ